MINHARLRSAAPKRQTRRRSGFPCCHSVGCGLWYGETNAVANAIGYAEHFSRLHDAVIRVYDAAGNVLETHEHKGDLEEY